MDWTVSMSVSFSDISTEIKFCSLLGKKRKVPQIQRKNSCWVVDAHTKAFNRKFIKIWLKLFKYSLGVPASQSSTKLRETYFKENLFLGNLPKLSPDLMIRYDTYFFSNNFVLRAQP